MTRTQHQAVSSRRHATELRISGATITLPGSAQAVAAGCTCNPRRNNNGLGRTLPNDQVLLVISYDCPLHELFTA